MILQEVAKLQSVISDSMVAGWNVEEVCELKFCPVTSVDVERYFSTYKHILDDRAHKPLEETPRILLLQFFLCQGTIKCVKNTFKHFSKS